MGDRAFQQLLEPHLGAVHRLARRLARSAADAEDLCQVALLRAFEHRGELRDPKAARAWLLTLTRRLHLNRVRDERPHLTLLKGSAEEAGAEGPVGNLSDELHARSLSDETAAALRALPEEQATALWLREVEGLSYEELADVFDCPVGTVRSRLARARAAMLEALEPGRRVCAGGRR